MRSCLIGLDRFRTGSRDFSYDPVGRLTREGHDAADAISYQYDANGRVTRRSYPGGLAVDYSYDADGRLLTVAPNIGGGTSYQYDPNNNTTRTTYPDGYLDVRAYDGANRLDSITHSRSGQPLNTITYTRDGNGRPTAIGQTVGGPEKYVYDAAGQVTDACYADPCLSASPKLHFEYDPVGNRLVESRSATVTNYV